MTTFADPHNQAQMIIDTVRVSSFAEAIRETVRPGDIVMDIGSGTGLLALLAARCGASKVYAIERTSIASMIEPNARENGYGTVVEVIQADVAHVPPSRITIAPRVLITETLGNFAAGEGIHECVASARRFAAPDVVTIPRAYRLTFCAAVSRFHQLCQAAINGAYGVRLPSLRDSMATSVGYRRVTEDELCSQLEFGHWTSVLGPAPALVTANLSVEKKTLVTAVVVAWEALLSDNVILRTSPGSSPTHWNHVVLPVCPPLHVTRGNTLLFRMYTPDPTDATTWSWSVDRDTGRE